MKTLLEKELNLVLSRSDTLLAAAYEDFSSLDLYYCWSIECFGCERCDQTFESEGSAPYQLSR